MYEYINGKITDVSPYHIVVENNGLGYLVYVANPFSYQVESQQKVYLYQAVRDNDISLYGFKNKVEKQLFLKLLNVSGIGPKSALAILASDDLSGLVTAINNDDDGYLVKFPGIGKKTAKQIILDLKGKLADLGNLDQLQGQQGLALDLEAENQYVTESLEALLALGYTKTELKKLKPKLLDYQASSTDEYLRYGLKLLMRK